jgi:nucleolar complex protein 3
LKFDEDLGKDESKEEKLKPKKNKRFQNRDVTKPSEKKKIKKEMLLKARQEVTSDVAYSRVA